MKRRFHQNSWVRHSGGEWAKMTVKIEVMSSMVIHLATRQPMMCSLSPPSNLKSQRLEQRAKKVKKTHPPKKKLQKRKWTQPPCFPSSRSIFTLIQSFSSEVMIHTWEQELSSSAKTIKMKSGTEKTWREDWQNTVQTMTFHSSKQPIMILISVIQSRHSSLSSRWFASTKRIRRKYSKSIVMVTNLRCSSPWEFISNATEGQTTTYHPSVNWM